MRCIRLTLQYDGTAYHGWQRQPGQVTVQGTLTAHLAAILGERHALEGAGRTDSGVHALGQVAALKTDHAIEPPRLQAALNSRLPPDILITEARYVWHWYRPLNVDRMREAARLLLGRHDFRGFESRGSARAETVREIFRFDVIPSGREIHLEVEADGFLYRMVRNLVGTLTEVGRGHRPVEWVRDVLAAKDRTAAGPTAPPQGLFLVSVRYPDGL